MVFETCLKVALPFVKCAWQLCRWCYAHVLIIILQQHHKESPQKVSSRYLYWFPRYTTFSVFMGVNFSKNWPSLVQSGPMMAYFHQIRNPMKCKTLNISRTNEGILMKLSVDLPHDIVVKWWWVHGCGTICIVATPTLPRAVLLSNTIQKPWQKIKIFQKFFLHAIMGSQKLQKHI